MAKQKWLPITKYMPHKAGLYLVTKYDAFVDTYFTWVQYYSLESGFGEGYNGVAAWMPTPIHLPEPYKGGSPDRI